jgi:hypothetical protein
MEVGMHEQAMRLDAMSEFERPALYEVSKHGGLEGPFFVTETARKPDMERLAKEARESPPHAIIVAVLEETGLLPTADEAKERREAGNDFWKHNNKLLNDQQEQEMKRILEPDTRRELLLDLVEAMDRKQRSFWADYNSRQGQDVDAVEALFAATEPYEQSTLLATFDSLYHRVSVNPHLQDAERMARLLILHELNFPA